jgi:DNA-binding transcriptional MerR regulator
VSDKPPVLGPDSEIPDKLYFKIGEVAELVGVQAHVLRYWEKEVSAIRPSKSASKQRRYRRRDVEIFREIRRLLYQERYTLAGAKKRLFGGEAREDEATPDAAPEAAATVVDAAPQLDLGFAKPAAAEKLERVREGLRELVRMSGEEV